MAIIYTNSAAAADTGDGLSWETAKKTLLAAVNAAIAGNHATVQLGLDDAATRTWFEGANGSGLVMPANTTGQRIELVNPQSNPANAIVRTSGDGSMSFDFSAANQLYKLTRIKAQYQTGNAAQYAFWVNSPTADIILEQCQAKCDAVGAGGYGFGATAAGTVLLDRCQVVPQTGGTGQIVCAESTANLAVTIKGFIPGGAGYWGVIWHGIVGPQIIGGFNGACKGIQIAADNAADIPVVGTLIKNVAMSASATNGHGILIGDGASGTVIEDSASLQWGDDSYGIVLKGHGVGTVIRRSVFGSSDAAGGAVLFKGAQNVRISDSVIIALQSGACWRESPGFGSRANTGNIATRCTAIAPYPSAMYYVGGCPGLTLQQCRLLYGTLGDTGATEIGSTRIPLDGTVDAKLFAPQRRR